MGLVAEGEGLPGRVGLSPNTPHRHPTTELFDGAGGILEGSGGAHTSQYTCCWIMFHPTTFTTVPVHVLMAFVAFFGGGKISSFGNFVSEQMVEIGSKDELFLSFLFADPFLTK